MCGIIGYLGSKSAAEMIYNGLKRMEYRGYDSAGIATLDNQTITITKEAGKVINLKSKIAEHKIAGIGIGHTRWATHGEPNQVNAHPHQVGDIVIVHNGIIENFLEIKHNLLEKGYHFQSETDSEVLAALIDSHYQVNHDLIGAVKKALHQIKGTYGLVVMSRLNPDELICARLSSPVIIGRGANSCFIASDQAALAGNVRNITYLEDGEIAVCRYDNIEVFNIEGHSQDKEFIKLHNDRNSYEKSGYKHYMLKEIMQQAETVRSTLRGRINKLDETAQLGGLNLNIKQIRGIRKIQIVGCGTAYHAGVLAGYYLEEWLQLPVRVEFASEYRYRDPAIIPGTIGVAISQSGETADTLASIAEMKRQGIFTIGVVNVVGSTISRAVDGGVYLHAGPEVSVASTKAFTSQVIVLLLIGLYLGRYHGLSSIEGRRIIDDLIDLPGLIDKNLANRAAIEKIAQEVQKFDNIMYLGRGKYYPIAMEGALKIKELAYINANAYPAGEMKHGPNALLDSKMLVIFLLPNDELYDKAYSNLEEVRARGAKVLIITDNPNLEAVNDDMIIRFQAENNISAPLICNLVLQLLAYYVADYKKLDVDQPRNLAKSVTVE